MAKAKGAGRRISPRTAAKLVGAAAIFVVGLAVGGGCSSSNGGVDRDQVRACVPIASTAQLDQCLGGHR